MIKYDYADVTPRLSTRFLRFIFWGLRPREGWLALMLVLGAVFCVTKATIAAQWLDKLDYLQPVGLFAALLLFLLAKSSVKAWQAGLISVAMGGVVSLLAVGEVLPSRVLGVSWRVLGAEIGANVGAFFGRLIQWQQTISQGGTSHDPIAFALLLTLAIWAACALLSWTTFRNGYPLPTLIIMLLALAINSYFSTASTGWLLWFVAILIPLATLMRHVSLTQQWASLGIDYSREIKVGLLLPVIALTLFLLAATAFSPLFSIRHIAKIFANSAFVTQIEDALNRSFAGVNGKNAVDGTNGARGVLPRAYLLSSAPDLLETVVMTATVTGDAGAIAHSTHWRAINYDVYTGRGWAVADEREVAISAETPLNLPPFSATSELTSRINWQFDTRLTRYTLGFPTRFEDDVTAFWRDRNDLVRVHGDSNTYTTTSLVSIATPAQLQAATLANIPAPIINRYTQLPDDIPQRVYDLAQQIVADAPTPYEQAVAIEQFVRQYTYSLEIGAPPSEGDIVDYFLFDLQIGYCDYYASAMTVLARAVGLPARFATGFYINDQSGSGLQTLRQIDGHSWSEIYFAEYGWNEFEPTASFETAISAEQSPNIPNSMDTSIPTQPSPPIPDPPNSIWSATALLLLSILFAIISVGSRLALNHSDSLDQRYARLHRYHALLTGQASTIGMTPSEFLGQFLAGLEQWGMGVNFGRNHTQLTINQLTQEATATINALLEARYTPTHPPLPPAPILGRKIDWLRIIFAVTRMNNKG